MSAAAAAAVRSSELRVGAVRTRLLEAGPQDATEAVVFVHGNPGSASDWTELVAASGELDPPARAIAFDMPGFGHANVPTGFACDVPAYATFLDEARSELGVERAHLVLHDFGGPFGIAWAVQHPDAWASVVLINIGVMPGYRWHSLARRWRTPLVGELMHAWIPRFAWRRSMQGSSPRGLPLEFVDKMYDEYDRETRRTVLRLYRATPDPGRTAAELGAALRPLARPALVVWGAADPFIGVEYAQRQREFFDVRDVVILPESGHWPFQDDPQAVRDAIVPFLRERLAE
jgi:pimeloyl-ACP methyl ester carboxylesterase